MNRRNLLKGTAAAAVVSAMPAALATGTHSQGYELDSNGTRIWLHRIGRMLATIQVIEEVVTVRLILQAHMFSSRPHVDVLIHRGSLPDYPAEGVIRDWLARRFSHTTLGYADQLEACARWLEFLNEEAERANTRVFGPRLPLDYATDDMMDRPVMGIVECRDEWGLPQAYCLGDLWKLPPGAEGLYAPIRRFQQEEKVRAVALVKSWPYDRDVTILQLLANHRGTWPGFRPPGCVDARDIVFGYTDRELNPLVRIPAHYTEEQVAYHLLNNLSIIA